MSSTSEPAVGATRRAVVRTAAWAAPAVSLAATAPAFATSVSPTFTTSWALTADEDIAYTQAGDLSWTVQDADLEPGSTVELVISDPNGNLELYAWLEALVGLTGASIGAHSVPQGGSTTLTLTTTAAVPVGSSFGFTMGPENDQGSYSIAWTIYPANPVGSTATGVASWSASGGFVNS